MTEDYNEEDEPLATWEAHLLPGWEWEALEKIEEEQRDDLYYGRVKSPYTFGEWEYGHFTQEELDEVEAYRTDLDEHQPLYPDNRHLLSDVYETELEALFETDQNEGE